MMWQVYVWSVGAALIILIAVDWREHRWARRLHRLEKRRNRGH